MIAYLLEQVLYDLSTRRDARAAFAEDPQGFLTRYRLTPDATKMVADFDLAELQRIGVNPLLTYGYWMTNAPKKTRAAYLARLRGEGDGAWL